MLIDRESARLFQRLQTLRRDGFAAMIGVFVLSLTASVSAQSTAPPPGNAANPEDAHGSQAGNGALPALPRVVENACRTRSDWHGETLRCGNQFFSADMVRVVVGGSRYAFVLVGDARRVAVDGPTTYVVHLWKDGQLAVPRRVVRAGASVDSPRGERSEGFLALLHASLPRLPTLDDDAAERWLRGLALASEQAGASARMARRGTRRVLRVRGPRTFGLDGSSSATVVDAWLDDTGAWGVSDVQDVSTAPARREGRSVLPQDELAVDATRVRGNVRLEDGEAISGDGDFSDAQVVRALRQRLSAIRACYDNQLRRDPTLAGRVRVEWTIETTGSVRDVRATENTTNDSAVGICVTGVVSRLRWSPGPQGSSVTYSYPFVFTVQS